MILQRAPRVLLLVALCSPLAACFEPDVAFTRNGELRRLICGADSAFTVSTTANEGPQWSPDGNRLAYVGANAGRRDIFLLTVSGTSNSSPTNLTGGGTAIATVDFVWSPDGNWIFYTANNTNGLQSIYRVGANPPPGSIVLPPKPVTPVNVNSKHPSVSPDSQRFVYSASIPTAGRGRGSGSGLQEFGLYTADIEGNNATLLHATPGASETMPAWAPDGPSAAGRGRGRSGDRMLYVREPSQLYVIEPASHGLVTSFVGVLSSFNRPDRPVWSPDGRFIAFISYSGKLYVASSTAPYTSTCITCQPDAPPGLNIDQNPQWYAGSERLVFHRPVHHIPPLRNPEGLFTIKRDGTEETFLGIDGQRPHPQSKPRWCGGWVVAP